MIILEKLKDRNFLPACFVTSVLAATGALAGPVAELQCLEAQWQRNDAELRENRAMVWQWMHDLMQTAKQTSCSNAAFIAETPTWHEEPYFSWTCRNRASSFDTRLSFQVPDEAHREKMQSGMLLLNLTYSLTDPALIQRLDEGMEEVAEIILDTVEVLEDAGVEIEFESPDTEVPDIAPPQKVVVSSQEHFETVLPLQNTWGLTADLTWAPDLFETPADDGHVEDVRDTEELRTRIANIQAIHSILSDLGKTRKPVGIAIQKSSTAVVKTVELVTAQAKIWEREHIDIAVRKFRPFGEDVLPSQRGADSISVFDLKSWSKTAGTDWNGPSGSMMMEGVTELVFHFNAQREFFDSRSGDQDCKKAKVFPCLQLQGAKSVRVQSKKRFDATCGRAEGCDLTQRRWVNPHVEVVTHLKARDASPEQLARFLQKLETPRTKTLLTALDPDPAFDAAHSCRE